MKRLPLVIGLVLAVVILNLYINQQQKSESPPPPRQLEGLPWQIDVNASGSSTVFGVTLNESTLAEAVRVLGPDHEVAVVMVPNEPAALEVYYHRYTAAIFTGKLLLVGEHAEETLQGFIERAAKVKPLQSGARLITLDQDDLPAALAARVTTLTFVPSIALEKEIVLERFGIPAETIRTSETSEHLLYPDKGLDLLLDEEGKEILQYVAPREFDLVRQPLLQYK